MERETAGWASRVGFGTKLGWVLSFISPVHFSFLFLIQTTQILIEFKFQFEFKPSTQAKRTMHQHECNNKFLNLDKF
jgi:hypothetical protein